MALEGVKRHSSVEVSQTHSFVPGGSQSELVVGADDHILHEVRMAFELPHGLVSLSAFGVDVSDDYGLVSGG